MRTLESVVYQYGELGEKARERVLSDHRDINVGDNSWYAHIFDGARGIGFDIAELEADCRAHVHSQFVDSAMSCARKIVEDHDRGSIIYKLAQQFIADYSQLDDAGEIDEDGQTAFLHKLESAYLKILCDEYTYLVSDEAVINTINVNELEFLENGRQFQQEIRGGK